MKTQQRQHEILSKHSMRTQKIQISQNNSYKCISKHSTCSTRQIIHCWYTGKEVMPATKAQMFALRRSAVRIELSVSLLPRCRWGFTPVLGASFPRSLTVIKDTLSFALLIVYTYLCNRWCLSVTLWAGLLNKKLSGRRETARCCFLLNISLSHSRSVKVIRNDTLENGVISY